MGEACEWRNRLKSDVTLHVVVLGVYQRETLGRSHPVEPEIAPDGLCVENIDIGRSAMTRRPHIVKVFASSTVGGRQTDMQTKKQKRINKPNKSNKRKQKRHRVPRRRPRKRRDGGMARSIVEHMHHT